MAKYQEAKQARRDRKALAENSLRISLTPAMTMATTRRLPVGKPARSASTCLNLSMSASLSPAIKLAQAGEEAQNLLGPSTSHHPGAVPGVLVVTVFLRHQRKGNVEGDRSRLSPCLA